MLGQIEVNKVEAASGSLFVAGWRPAIGWVGASALAWTFILGPMVMFIGRFVGYTGAYPTITTEGLMTLITGMLGIGGMRTLEKIKGVSTNDLTDVPGRTQSQGDTTVNVSPAGNVSVQKEGASTQPAPVVKKKHFHIF